MQAGTAPRPRGYGHRVEFGVALVPDARDPHTPVRLALLGEQLGYDLVTVADDPSQPDLDETWTLLSWIAGVTSRIRLAADLRSPSVGNPAVLARSAASLDHLSGGRVVLVLGPVAHDHTGAVAEVIDVVRALWDVDERGLARYDGRHHHLRGAQRAAPAHDVPIVVAGSTPEVLELAGAQADGWSGDHADLCSEGLRGPEGLRLAHLALDAAARAAGRDPREVRRQLTVSGRFAGRRTGFLEGSPADWVDDLLPLLVEHGVGTVVVRSADPATLTAFAREVVPGLRAAVDRVTPFGSAGVRVRRASALAKRRGGIAYDDVPASIAQVVEPGDHDYHRFRSGYLRGGSPGIVLRAADARQVVDALAFARAHPGVPLSVRSAGHGISGRSTNDGGIVVDVSLMNAVEVLDEPTRRVRIGPGARWTDVAAALAPHGWALSSGDYGGVGVGGLATAGGIGYLSRAHGLTIDHLRAVEIVLADGTVTRADATENPELFWAVRGAGANFGVVTSFEFEVDEVGAVGHARLVSGTDDIAGFLREWGRVVEDSPRDLTSFLITGPSRAGQPSVVQTLSVVDSADPETVVARLQPIADLGALHEQDVRILPYAAVMANASDAEHHARGEPISRSGLVDHITPEFAAAAAAALRSGSLHWFQIRSVGGAVSDVDPDATAYAGREANFQVVAMGSREEAVDRAWATLRPFFQGLYLSFDSSTDPRRITDAFPPRTLARLRALKADLDPHNLFRDNFNITPDSAVERSAS
ncbi:LLM class flavin-dependent oxidoreductase [Pseudonocardia broussonetiae]|uniref:LLM class flavin-dependent oxidoreductase n=1 Tax=Pseudonocardia broussonetiae TaxID=2736640 RepID=A0A6M6JM97_9PSEU|nr:LLM class flavin-dependent oxidoreductase [Pseudonocardia broussonetiae]QJY47411.1 LLM class flavin-dependent oxidoreductase [Pseudonocardia broussonetiae]